MASKNLGAVIQRAISDGAFRRQLQSDPAAALRGFNLSPDEVAAIRSGDSGKLMSLGVDQRMSKAFQVSGAGLGGVTRSTTSDLGTSGTSNMLAGDQTTGAREGIVGDPGTTSREAITTDASGSTRSAFTPGDGASSSDALTSGNLSGTRAVSDSAPFDSGRLGVADPTMGGTRSVNDSAPFDSGRLTVSDGTVDGGRAVNDSAPFDSGRLDTSDAALSTRAVHDSPPFEGNVNAAATGTGDPFSGQYQGVSPDFQANLNQAAGGADGNVIGVSPDFQANLNQAAGDAGAAGGNSIAADDNYAVSSRMADTGDATSIRPVNDVSPFDSGINAAAPSGGEFLGDIQHDPGTDATHGFIPSDSADVQREMLDGTTDGGALGNTGGTGHPS